MVAEPVQVAPAADTAANVPNVATVDTQGATAVTVALVGAADMVATQAIVDMAVTVDMQVREAWAACRIT